MQPLVSVCVPVYNGEQTIEATIKSIVEQTYNNLEIIVVDNCSTDKTLHFVEKISDSRMKVFKNDTNVGMAGNWNRCIEHATGEYIQIVCADDLIDKDCIKDKVEMMQRDESIALVFSASVIIDEDDRVVMRRHLWKEDKVVDGNKLARESFHKRNLYGEPSNVLFRRKDIERVGLFSIQTRYTTDWDMWLRLSTLGKVGYLDKELLKYRMSMSNQTSSMSTKVLRADDDIFVKNVLEYNMLKTSVLDRIIHRTMYIARMYARKVFMYLKSK